MVLFQQQAYEAIRNPMQYTLGTAAKATGKSKSTLSRDIKGGKISATRRDDGSYEIDPAELHRVYPAVERGTSSWHRAENDPQPHSEHPETRSLAAELAAVRARLETIEAERERERSQLLGQIEDVQQDRDHWRQQATGLLTDQRRQQAAMERRSWWSRLFGVGRA
jgi:hypothetical protein